MHEREGCCISLVAGGGPGGLPTLEAVQAAAQLPVLPPSAREEMHG